MRWLIVYAALRIFQFGRKVHILGKYQARYASRLGIGLGAEDEKVLFQQSGLFRPIQWIEAGIAVIQESKTSSKTGSITERARKEGVDIKIELAYYPPYHSKYNPVERLWGVLENHWRGELPTSTDKALGLARTMTYRGIPPSTVGLIRKIYRIRCTSYKKTNGSNREKNSTTQRS